MAFDCQRCGTSFKRKDYLIAHLKRKKVCKPLKQDISTDEIIEELTKAPPNCVVLLSILSKIVCYGKIKETS